MFTKPKGMIHFCCTLALLLGAGSRAVPATGDRSSLTDRTEAERRVRALERQLAELQEQLKAQTGRNQELERRIALLAEQITDLEAGDLEPEAEMKGEGGRGLGPAASKVYSLRQGVSLGGYGEMLYENFRSSDESGAPVSRTDQLDFLRLILYAGYKFNDRIVFNSEIEFEHASTGAKGEAAVEFAYLDFLLKESLNIRAGMVLMPIGFVNELHEPPVFLGARRPYLEKSLIPTTWRENGAGVYGEQGPFSWRAYVTTALSSVGGVSGDASGFRAGGIRGGRSDGSKSAAEDLALSGRLDWSPAPGLLLGGSFYTGDSGQGAVAPGGETIGGRTTLVDVHGEYRRNGWRVRGLWVDTDVDDVDAINRFQGLTGDQSVGSSQGGWYGEVGYEVGSFIPYARYESFGTQKSVPAGYSRNPAMERTVTTIGVAWKPIPQVVVKADWNDLSNEAGTGVDQFNLALGFLF